MNTSCKDGHNKGQKLYGSVDVSSFLSDTGSHLQEIRHQDKGKDK